MSCVRWHRETIRTKQGAKLIMVGRPRKLGKREANGRVARAKTDPDDMTRDLDRFMDDPTAIYVTEAGGLTKIGISKNPSQRARSIQTGNGNVVRMVWYRWMHGPDAKKLEREIHKKYQGPNSHAHGEWYYMNAATAIDVVSRTIAQMSMFSVWERYSAFVERHWNDPARDRLHNPFGG